MNEETPDINKLNNAFENLLRSGGGSEDMWKTASKHALQLSQSQIYALTRIRFYARSANEGTRKILEGFYDDYMLLQNHRNTALFIVRLAESDSLRKFIGAGIQGQVKIDK